MVNKIWMAFSVVPFKPTKCFIFPITLFISTWKLQSVVCFNGPFVVESNMSVHLSDGSKPSVAVLNRGYQFRIGNALETGLAVDIIAHMPFVMRQ